MLVKSDCSARNVDLRSATDNFRWTCKKMCICNVVPIFQILCDQLLVEKKILRDRGSKEVVDLVKKEGGDEDTESSVIPSGPRSDLLS